MSDQNLFREISGAVTGLRERSGSFRKGVVTRVDTAGQLEQVTVAGIPMPHGIPGVAVGDVVAYWADQHEAVALVKLVAGVG